MNTNLLNEIELTLEGAADLMRTVMEDHAAVRYLIALLFLRFISAKSFNIKNKRNQVENNWSNFDFTKIIIPPESEFAFLQISSTNSGNTDRFVIAIENIEKANQSLSGIFSNGLISRNEISLYPNFDHILVNLYDRFAREIFDFQFTNSQNLAGFAFDFLVSRVFSKTTEKLDLPYTPKSVAKLVVELLKPKSGDQIMDPVCGLGSMLVSCINPSNDPAKNKSLELVGYEKNVMWCALTKLNFLFNGLDPSKISYKDSLDSLDYLDKKQFDIVLGNPPFSTPYNYNELQLRDLEVLGFGQLPKNRSDYAFILLMINALKETHGRMGVIVSHGVLFRGGAEGEIRKNLIKNNLIDAVIGLPAKLFFGTAIPVAIIVIRKDKKQKNILFIDASKDYDLVKIRNEINQEQIENIIQTVANRKTINEYSRIVDYTEIATNDFSLNISKYIWSVEHHESIDINAIQSERIELSASLKLKEEKLEYLLKKYSN